MTAEHMPEKNNRRTGARYEAAARKYLEDQGVTILAQNFRSKQGEIDLIGRDGRYLVFFEVKYRRNDAKGDPSEAVGSLKQHRIRETARYYLYSRRLEETTPCRFDVVSILGDRIRWIRQAFE